ncbi:MAG: FAD-dependent monooxygenase [Pseudomonadota bacterium]|nr:FAD-dependent monooxygenase [Pseudomonadota bacterium]
MTQTLTIAGAGLAGALLATLLARRGYSVDVFERRPDPRTSGYEGGRSINLALAERGLHGLRLAGLEREVMAQAVMMRGRMIHEGLDPPYLQRYGKDDSEVIWSVNRGRLNMSLLAAAEAAGARIRFDERLTSVEWQRKVYHTESFAGVARTHEFNALIGADGAGSALRAAMNAERPLGERFEPLGHGYKELSIPALAGGGFRIERNALHIWPRGGHMLIALPNVDGSFTVTLFLPNSVPSNESAPSFATLRDVSSVRAFFERDFPDAVPLLPELIEDFTGNQTGLLATLRLDHWHHGGEALLIGDAAHAIVPFHGQGMNCAFEDCVELDALFGESSDLSWVFGELEARRKPNARAIADMALENYLEMRDAVVDDRFQLMKQVERLLAVRHPDRFVPRYTMVSFRRVPYAQAMARGHIQSRLLHDLTEGVSNVDQIDLAVADARINAELSPL